MSNQELSKDEIVLRELAVIQSRANDILRDVILPAVTRIVAAHNDLTSSRAEAWLNDNDTAVKVKKPFLNRLQKREWVAEMAIRFGQGPREIVATARMEDTKGSKSIGKADIRARIDPQELYFMVAKQSLTPIQLADLWVKDAFLDLVHDE